MLAIALALGSSLPWGVSDFLGGLKSRSLPLLVVLLISQAAALIVLAAIVLSLREGPPCGELLLFAGLAGLSEAAGVVVTDVASLNQLIHTKGLAPIACTAIDTTQSSSPDFRFVPRCGRSGLRGRDCCPGRAARASAGAQSAPAALLHPWKGNSGSLAARFHAMGARLVGTSHGRRAVGFRLALPGVAREGRALLAVRGGIARRAHSLAGGAASVRYSDARGGVMSELLLDAAGRCRSPAMLPDFHAGRPPRNKRIRYPADPPTVEEIVAVTRAAGSAHTPIWLSCASRRLRKRRPRR